MYGLQSKQVRTGPEGPGPDGSPCGWGGGGTETGVRGPQVNKFEYVHGGPVCSVTDQ